MNELFFVKFTFLATNILSFNEAVWWVWFSHWLLAAVFWAVYNVLIHYVCVRFVKALTDLRQLTALKLCLLFCPVQFFTVFVVFKYWSVQALIIYFLSTKNWWLCILHRFTSKNFSLIIRFSLFAFLNYTLISKQSAVWCLKIIFLIKTLGHW